MSDSSAYTGRSAAPLATDVMEVQGVFASDVAMQDAIGRLTLLGIDRAAMALPQADGARTPEQSSANPHTEDDNRQVRTLGSSMAATVGAFAAAGAVIATGGLAAPAVAAAVAGGVGAGGLAHAAATASKDAQEEKRDRAAADGHLMLTVTVPDETAQMRVVSAMRDAGALTAAPVQRN